MASDLYNSRYHLLNWVNQLCSLKLSSVEQCASGAAHLQIMDALFPHAVPMHRVKWDAKFEYEYISNFKLLQMCFAKLNIPKHIEVDRLVKGRYQDNFEFLQWMKSFFDSEIYRRGGSGSIDDYDGESRRQLAKCAMPSWAQIKSKTASTASIPTRQKAPLTRYPKGNDSGNSKDGDSAHGIHPPSRSQFYQGRADHPPHLPNSNNQNSNKIDNVMLRGGPTAAGGSTPPGNAAEIGNFNPTQTINSLGKNLVETTAYARQTPMAAFNGHTAAGSVLQDAENQHATNSNANQAANSFYQSADTLKIIREQNETIKELRATIETLNSQFNLEHNQLAELQKQFDECNLERETLIVEKDFFYNKLRKLEIMCDDDDEASLPARIVLEVLYASDDLANDLGDDENADQNAEIS